MRGGGPSILRVSVIGKLASCKPGMRTHVLSNLCMPCGFCFFDEALGDFLAEERNACAEIVNNLYFSRI